MATSSDRFTMRLIRERNTACGFHFFDRDTLRFFKSRIPSGAVGRVNDDAWFVTSERAPAGIRRYTVRHADMSTGEVRTAGEFQAYSTAARAVTAARHLIREASAA